MEEVYYGEYQENQGIMEVTLPDCLLGPTQISNPGDNFLLAGDAWHLYAEQMNGLPESLPTDMVSTGEAIDALTIAHKTGQWQSIDAIEINYLRKKDAWQRS